MDAKKCSVLAAEIRLETLKVIHSRGFGHVGGSMDLADLMAVLYGEVMKFDPKNPRWEDRDWLVLSKGHAGPVAYATFGLMGFYPLEEAYTLNQPHTKFPSHTDRKLTPGVDLTTGSLGQGASTAAGAALGNKIDGRTSHVFCVVGDGEADEGEVWEAFQFAYAHKLDNLIYFIDKNGYQLDGPTDDILPHGDIAKKAASFGLYTQEIDGHDVQAIYDAIQTADAEGMYMIYGRQSCDTRKMEQDASIDVGNAKFGGQEALVVLDHVFIPNEYIFLNGEYEFAGMIVERFAGYHRQSYGGCKVGVGDTLIGAAALAAEYNGVEKASAVKDKLIEMTHLNETLFCCGIACSAQGFKTKAGNYQIDLLLANVCKQNVTRFPYEIVRLAEDIAGGLMVTMPSQVDFHSDMVVGRNGETIGQICNKFFAAREGVSTENRQRIMRFIENLCLGAAAVGYRTESMHGAGSPQAQRIMIARQGNIQGKKQLAKDIAGIVD